MEPETAPPFKDLIKGKSILFGEGKDLVWAIKMELPLTNEIKAKMKEDWGLKIPIEINHIAIYDFHPQENLSLEERTIGKKDNGDSGVGFLTGLAQDSEGHWLTSIIQNMHLSSENSEKINEIMQQGTHHKSIGLIMAHGKRSREWFIGEHEKEAVKDKRTHKTLQKFGNRIRAQEVIDYLNDKEDHSIILFHACNLNKGSLSTSKSPVVYNKGWIPSSTQTVAFAFPNK